MNTAYTPGPWQARCETDGRTRTHYVKIGSSNCYLTRGIGETEAEVQANARLIASAPTLLEALQAFIIDAEAFEKGYMATELRPFTRERLLDNARLTIAQATGGNEK